MQKEWHLATKPLKKDITTIVLQSYALVNSVKSTEITYP
jgi:hypothetical protein